MLFFTRYLWPFLTCSLCEEVIDSQATAKETMTVEDDLSDIVSLESEHNILKTLNDATFSRFQINYDVVYNELCGPENKYKEGTKVFTPIESEITGAQEMKQLSGGDKADVQLLNINEELIFTPRELEEKQLLLGIKKISFPAAYENRKELCKSLAKSSIVVPDLDMQTDHLIICKIHSCTAVISKVYVIRALRQFVVDFHKVSKQFSQSHIDRLINKNRYTLSRLIDNNDVEDYWNKYKNVFNEDRQEMWNVFQMAMKNYVNDLRRRHKLNEDIKKIKNTNIELRRLLQRYLEPRKNTNVFESINEKVDEAIRTTSTSESN